MRIIFTLLLSILFSCSLFAQEKKSFDFSEKPLDEVVQVVEENFDVRFSFSSETIEGKKITLSGEFTLENLLDILSEKIKLDFIKVDYDNVVIRKRKDSQKRIKICGTLTDDLDGLPVQDASITIKDRYHGTVSNVDGEFILDDVSTEDIILVEFLGFEKIEIPAVDFLLGSCKEIQMIESATVLSEIILPEYITTGFDRNNHDGSVSLDPSKLGILPGLTEPDVLQSLQLLPGISSPNESATDLHIRGGTPDQNLILWDGIKTYHQGHFFGQISAFNPYITEKVDIYRSGTSARYGDRISGVIDIQSDSEIPNKLEAGAGFNLTQADAYVKAPIKKEKFAIIASARRSFSDILNTITFENLSSKVFQNTKIETAQGTEDENFDEIRNEFYFTDANLKANWRPSEKDEVAISGLFVTNFLDYNVTTDELNEQDRLDLTNNGASINWKRTASDKLTINFRSYYSNYYSNYSFNRLDIDDNENESLSKENNINDFGVSGMLNYDFNEKHTFNGGYDFVNNEVFYRIDTDEYENEKEISHSIFGEYVFNNNDFLIRAGIRGNYFSSDETIYLEPRIYLEKKLIDELTFKASGEVKNQIISQLVLFDFNEIGVGNNIWVLADDEDIPVLNNYQVSSGFLFQNNGWSIDIDGYYKKVSGLTSFGRGFNNSTSNTYSEGTSDTFGVDILLKKRIQNFRTWVSYSLSKTEFTFSELNTTRFPGNFDQRHILNFSNTFKWNQFQFSLGWTMATGRPYSRPTGIDTTIDGNGNQDNNLIFDRQNDERLDTYHKLDFSVLYDFSIGKNKKYKARVGASALNVYNRENEIDKVFRIDPNSADPTNDPQIIEQTRIGLGITPNVVFRISF